MKILRALSDKDENHDINNYRTALTISREYPNCTVRTDNIVVFFKLFSGVQHLLSEAQNIWYLHELLYNACKTHYLHRKIKINNTY